jgi:hypothetical protein
MRKCVQYQAKVAGRDVGILQYPSSLLYCRAQPKTMVKRLSSCSRVGKDWSIADQNSTQYQIPRLLGGYASKLAMKSCREVVDWLRAETPAASSGLATAS